MLSCCKCLFEKIEADLAHIQAENLQNLQKMHFWQKARGVNGFISRQIL